MKQSIPLLTVLLVAPAMADSYVGISGGQSSIKIDTTGADQVNDTDSAGKVFGGASLEPGLGVEVGLVDLGTFSAHYVAYDETDTIDAAAFYGAVLGRLPLGAADLFVKGGLAYWGVAAEATATVGGTVYHAAGEGNGADLMFGAGVNFRLADKLGVRAEYERFRNVGDGTEMTVPGVATMTLDGGDVDLVSVGVTYSF